MTAFLNQGVKAKMCETTPFVNSVGSQYIAARAQLQLACDSIRSQSPALGACIGLSDGIVHRATESNSPIAKSLLKDVTNTWSTMVNGDEDNSISRRCVPRHSSKSSSPSFLQTSSTRMSPMASSTDNVGSSSSRTATECHCRALS